MYLFVQISILTGISSIFALTGNDIVNIIRKKDHTLNVVEQMEKLIEADEEVVNKRHDDGTLPLDAAITLKNEDIANVLINRNANVNIKMRNGLYPVHAVIHYNLDYSVESTMELLLTKNVNFKNTVLPKGNNSSYGATCLHTAVYCENKRMLNMLLAKKPEILEIIDQGNETAEGRTVLHETVELRYRNERNAMSFTKAVLDAGANVYVTDVFKRTALHYAARVDRAQVAKMLIDRGASRWAKDKYGNTPLRTAELRHSHRVTKVLLQAEKNYEEEKLRLESYERATRDSEETGSSRDSKSSVSGFTTISGISSKSTKSGKNKTGFGYSIRQKFFRCMSI